MLNVSVHVERIDPLDLDLDTAEEMVAVDRASLESAGLELPAPSGPTRLTYLRLTSTNRPMAGVWLARDGGRVVGYAVANLPVEDNTGSAHMNAVVHPSRRREGIGEQLMGAALDLARAEGRRTFYAGAFRGGPGGAALEAMGFSARGLGVNAIRRVDVHGARHGTWDRVHDEAAAHGPGYELVHLVGPTPDDLLDDMVTLHAAINDAPLDDPEEEEDRWDVDRVRSYDLAMAGRRQTVHRVLARHRDSGEWAGLSILCVDEFSPGVAFQEDTSVVRGHRGHRLGLRMKADMLRWVALERPEVSATDTWNATTNHHMIAVNERLGARVIAHHETYRLKEG